MTGSIQAIFQRRIKPLLLSKTAQWLFSIGAIAFTGLVLGVLVWRERDVLFHYRWSVDFQALGLAFVTYTLALFLASFIWIRIVNTMGVRVSFWSHFRHFCISMLARRLPGTVWYVAYRNQMYEKEGLSVQLTTLASGIEYALLMVSSILVAFLLTIHFASASSAQLWLGIVALVVFISFLHPRVLGWILRKLGKVEMALDYRHILAWLVMYIGVRLLSGLLVFFIARIIFPVPYQQIWFVIGGWNMVGIITNLLLFSPSNMGLTEVTFSLVLSSLMPSPIAVIAAVLTRIVTMSFELVWALASLLLNLLLNRVKA